MADDDGVLIAAAFPNGGDSMAEPAIIDKDPNDLSDAADQCLGDSVANSNIESTIYTSFDVVGGMLSFASIVVPELMPETVGAIGFMLATLAIAHDLGVSPFVIPSVAPPQSTQIQRDVTWKALQDWMDEGQRLGVDMTGMQGIRDPRLMKKLLRSAPSNYIKHSTLMQQLRTPATRVGATALSYGNAKTLWLSRGQKLSDYVRQVRHYDVHTFDAAAPARSAQNTATACSSALSPAMRQCLES